MPHPRLTPTLNNCALHAVTPEICVEVKKYAANGDYDNEHNPEYRRLKDVFAVFYKFDRTQFTWKHFDSILSSYNPFDVQIILGPVLRAFMKSSMVANEMTSFIAEAEGLSLGVYIDRFTSMSEELHGRYRSIDPEALAAYVGQPLGITICYTKAGVRRGDPVVNEIALVDIHHFGDMEGNADGHWERVADRTECVDYESQSKLACILPLLGQHALVSTFGLELLKGFILQTATRQQDALQDVILSSSQIDRYQNMILFVPQKIAIEFLGTEPTRTTQLFIDRYPYTPIHHGQVVETALRVPDAVGCQAILNRAQAQVVGRVLSELPPSKARAFKDPTLYPRLCGQAREVASEAITSVEAIRVNFSNIGRFDDVDTWAGDLETRVRRRITVAKERLVELLQPLNNFSQLDVVQDQKLQEIDRAALAKKRELRQAIINEARFDACIQELRERIAGMSIKGLVEPHYKEAAGKNKQLIIELIEAKDAFVSENKTLEQSKIDFREACRAAINAVKSAPALPEQPLGWALPRFLSGLTRGNYSSGLTLFSVPEHEEHLKQTETNLVENPLFSVAPQ